MIFIYVHLESVYYKSLNKLGNDFNLIAAFKRLFNDFFTDNVCYIEVLQLISHTMYVKFNVFFTILFMGEPTKKKIRT